MRTLAAALAATIMTIPQIPTGSNLPVYGYQIVHVYPHDAKAFTQGLQYLDGVFYEGTGQVGQSSIRKVEVETGKVLQQRDVPGSFAETMPHSVEINQGMP